MTEDAGRAALHKAGARTMAGRGFYSHFLRVWYPYDARISLGTIDFTSRGNLRKASIDKMLRRVAATDPTTIERTPVWP